MVMNNKLHIDLRLFAGILVLTLVLGLALGVLIALELRPEPTTPTVTNPTEADPTENAPTDTAPTDTAPTDTTPPETSTGPTLPPNPFDSDDFTYGENGYLTTDAGVAIPGIDVSEHQQHIDWEQVKASGIEFVMIRVGWRGQTQGLITEDTLAQEYYAGAKAAGLKIGAYFFSQAISPEEAIDEAEYMLEMIRDWEVDMPLVYDWEPISPTDRTAVVDSALLTQCVRSFCDTVDDAGYRPMVYFNSFLADTLLQLDDVKDYPFWLALYTHEMDYPHAVEMWQYSCTGQVPGIALPVDLDLWFPESQS